MKIIEAMKEVKRQHEKATDLRARVAKYAADLDFEKSTYDDQRAQLGEWVQSHYATVQRIADLRVAIQRTNLAIDVTIELSGKQVTKTIAEWIHWRKDLAKLQLDLYTQMQERDAAGRPLRDGHIQQTSGAPITVKVRRYFDPAVRDEKMLLYKSEPSIIDGMLEVVNATTDVIGL